ncbi:MAG: TrkA family potassium uptake protein [Lachnospiraceae bacterium]|nr:TrkA family potassium uptake protein [Lachnospiraceae bacterium]
MKSFLVIGLGRFGKQIVKKLDEMKHEVLAVDINEERVQAVLPYATNAQIGDSTDGKFLRSLGVSNFDVCIVAIGDNFQNSLETTSLLKELGAKMVVSRAARDVHAKFLARNGADHVVYPEKQLATWTAIRYSSDHVLDYIEMEQDFSIFEVEVPKNWIGHTVQQINIRKEYQLNIVAIKNNGFLNPEVGPDYCFDGNETIWVIGKNKNIQKCFHI